MGGEYNLFLSDIDGTDIVPITTGQLDGIDVEGISRMATKFWFHPSHIVDQKIVMRLT